VLAPLVALVDDHPGVLDERAGVVVTGFVETTAMIDGLLSGSGGPSGGRHLVSRGYTPHGKVSGGSARACFRKSSRAVAARSERRARAVGHVPQELLERHAHRLAAARHAALERRVQLDRQLAEEVLDLPRGHPLGEVSSTASVTRPACSALTPLRSATRW
jgi:hypothetical protein